MELFFIWNIYILARIQNSANSTHDEFGKVRAEALTFKEVWFVPDRYNCRLGEEAHSACSQVIKFTFKILCLFSHLG